MLKEEIARKEQFLYPFGKLSAILIKFENCRLQTLSVWKGLKSVVWERVKS